MLVVVVGLWAILNCTLEELDLVSSGLNNNTMTSLALMLGNSRSLGSLDLYYNRGITISGWEVLSAVLQNPDPALEKLNLELNSINDVTALSLSPMH